MFLAATAAVEARFPEYIAGYLIQIPALVLGYFYATKFDLLNRYPRWQQRVLLLISFAIPLQNTFVLKAARKYLMDGNVALEAFRPAVFILLVVTAASLANNDKLRLPKLIVASFVTGLFGWLLSSSASDYPGVSLGTGLFEFLCPFAAVYALSVNALDRAFLLHCLKLFIISFALVALAQASVILATDCSDAVLGLPLLADEFLELKKSLPLMQVAGANAYGNTDNFVSLWVLIIPLTAGLYYRRKSALWAIALFALLYLGLLVYSRSGILAVTCGLTGIVVHRAVAFRAFSALPAAALAALLLIHVPSGGAKYFVDGIYSFITTLQYPTKEIHSYDASGVDRMEAMRRGVAIASEHPITGVGYGVYPIVEPELTAPHNMLLLRFAEGGIFSAVSLLLLASFAIASAWRQFFSRDIVAMTAAIGLGCFLLKGMIFGATFSIGGQISWGFGVAILIAVLSTQTNRNNV